MSSEQMYRSVKDYYAILDVSDRDSREEMRHALGQPAMKYHPGRNLGNEQPAPTARSSWARGPCVHIAAG